VASRSTAAIEVRDVTVVYSSARGLSTLLNKHQVQIIQDINLTIRPGTVFGIAGESGSGKTTLARALTGLAPVGDGSIKIHGREVADLNQADWREVRSEVQLIFQDPYDSLNPRFTVFDSVAEPLRSQGIKEKPEVERRVRTALEDAELEPDIFSYRMPSQLSGGERQRVAIARALVLDPNVIIADEPVSMLDVSTRGEILSLIRKAARDRGVAVVLVSHDLSVLERVCDEIAVMYLGRIVEQGAVADVFRHPRHPYTKALISAIPSVDQTRKRDRTTLRGEPPQPAQRPPGCSFHPRCPRCDESQCLTELPLLEGKEHQYACWHPIEIVQEDPT
jgi:oligopeptide/dipeptide ABC transporter ATP-binding protein